MQILTRMTINVSSSQPPTAATCGRSTGGGGNTSSSGRCRVSSSIGVRGGCCSLTRWSEAAAAAATCAAAVSPLRPSVASPLPKLPRSRLRFLFHRHPSLAPSDPLRHGAAKAAMMPPVPSPLPMPAGSRANSNDVKVVVNGVSSELGKAAVKAVVAARGLQLAGVVDTSAPQLSGRDAGEVVGLPESLELPIMSDVVMVLASIAQSRSTSGAVYVDLTGNPDQAYENLRQAGAFGLSAVVGECEFSLKQLKMLLEFCDKASMGCLVAPNLHIGTLLLQQAAVAMAFHYGNVDVFESHSGPALPSYPSPTTRRLADELSNIGREFNTELTTMATEDPAFGAEVGDSGVRVHSSRHPGLLSSLDVRFAAPGQTLTLRTDVSDVRALIPGLTLAIRRAARLKNLVFGLEKVL